MARKIRLACTAAALIPLAVIAAACGSSSSTTPKATTSPTPTAPKLSAVPASAAESLSETGSSLLFPLAGAWATAYSAQYSQVKISTASTGSGTGVSDATSGTVNIGASDAYLSSSDLTAAPTLLNVAMAISAQEISFNVPGVTSLKLDGTVIAQIYDGKITNWDASQIAALNPGVTLPNLPIVTLHRSDSSGDTFLFTSYLNDQDPTDWATTLVNTAVSWPAVPGALAEDGNSGMVSGCAATKGCIAYIGISYESKTQAAGLGQAVLKNGAGNYESPTATTIAAESNSFSSQTPANETISLIDGKSAKNGYPIVNYEYFIVNSTQSNPTVAQDIKAFMYWAVTTGQSSTYLGPVNFQPLPKSILTLTEDQIAKIGS